MNWTTNDADDILDHLGYTIEDSILFTDHREDESQLSTSTLECQED